MIITDKDPEGRYYQLVEYQTKKNEIGLIVSDHDKPFKVYSKVKSFNTETKEAEFYAEISSVIDKTKKWQIALAKTKIDIVTFKCYLPKAFLYNKKTKLIFD